MNNPLFGITLSLIAYLLFVKIQEKTKITLLNPLLFSGLFIILVLSLSKISYETYNLGGSFITMLITPATISLALPLYKNLEMIKANYKVIGYSIIGGVLIHALVLILMIKILGVDERLAISLIPKSITSAMGNDLSVSLGGIKEITMASILVTGIIGAALSPLLNKLFNIKEDTSIGLALGSSSHAVGTGRAASQSETQGSFSSIALILTGLVTVFLSPVILFIVQAII